MKNENRSPYNPVSAYEIYQLVVETAPNAMIMVNKEGKVTLVNQQAESLFGYTREELLGQTIEMLVPERFRSKHPGYRNSFFADPKARTMGAGRDLFGLKKDGTELPIEIGLNPIETPEGLFTLASIIDITERKRAEEKQAELLKAVERSNRELNEFAYAVSHDLKAPLRGIASLAEWIGTDYSKKIGEEGRKQFGLLSSRVKRMDNLIDGILHYSRIERAREKKEAVDTNELLREVIDLLAPPEHITLRIERPLPTLVFERAHLHQLFQNLLSNAIRFMDKSKGEIKVNCVGEGAYWKFSIQDNGAGIDKKYHERIFRLFETLAAHDETESTGIGLALVKKIVERAGGKVWVESQLGQGSTFFFTLPRQHSERGQVVT